MSVTHQITIRRYDGASVVEKTIDVTSGAALQLDEAIPASSTDLAVALTFAVAKLKYIWILADAAMTLETNSGSAAADTITLVANKPFLWEVTYDANLSNPFSIDVTGLFVTSSAGGQLQLSAIVDPT
jgi:hypothetical protein